MPINPSTACMRSLWSWFWSQAATGLFPLTHVACSNPNLQMIRFRSRSIHFPIPHEYSKGVKQLYSMETTCRILYSNSYEYLKKIIQQRSCGINTQACTHTISSRTYIYNNWPLLNFFSSSAWWNGTLNTSVKSKFSTAIRI